MSQVEESEATYAEVSSLPMAKEKFEMEENQCYGSLKVAPKKNTMNSYGKGRTTAITVIFVLVVLLIVALASCCLAFAFEISMLKSAMSAEQDHSLSTRLNASVVDLLLKHLNIWAEREESLNTIIFRVDSLNSSFDMLLQQLLLQNDMMQ